MIDASIVAQYFLSNDYYRKLFNNGVVISNGRKSNEDIIRLNNYLFLTQVVYLAKYDKKLLKENFIASENGPVIESIIPQDFCSKNAKVQLPDDMKSFLDKIYFALENATNDELTKITHEDPEWIKLNKDKSILTMNLESNINIYKQRYRGLIEALKI